MIEDWPKSVRNMVDIFGTFSFVSSLKLDWDKFVAYWQSMTGEIPTWLNHCQWKWARNEEFSKLLGIGFGLSLDVKDVDEFLMSKI